MSRAISLPTRSLPLNLVEARETHETSSPLPSLALLLLSCALPVSCSRAVRARAPFDLLDSPIVLTVLLFILLPTFLLLSHRSRAIRARTPFGLLDSPTSAQRNAGFPTYPPVSCSRIALVRPALGRLSPCSTRPHPPCSAVFPTCPPSSCSRIALTRSARARPSPCSTRPFPPCNPFSPTCPLPLALASPRVSSPRALQSR